MSEWGGEGGGQVPSGVQPSHLLPGAPLLGGKQGCGPRGRVKDPSLDRRWRSLWVILGEGPGEELGRQGWAPETGELPSGISLVVCGRGGQGAEVQVWS